MMNCCLIQAFTLARTVNMSDQIDGYSVSSLFFPGVKGSHADTGPVRRLRVEYK